MFARKHFKQLINFCRLWSNTKRRCVLNYFYLYKKKKACYFLFKAHLLFVKSACIFEKISIVCVCGCTCSLCLLTSTFFLNQFLCIFPVDTTSMVQELVKLWFVILRFYGHCSTDTLVPTQTSLLPWLSLAPPPHPNLVCFLVTPAFPPA